MIKCKQVPVTQTVYERISIMIYSFCSGLNSDKPSRSQFWTCHVSWTVKTCVNMWSDSKYFMRDHHISYNIRIMSSSTFFKWVPGTPIPLRRAFRISRRYDRSYVKTSRYRCVLITILFPLRDPVVKQLCLFGNLRWDIKHCGDTTEVHFYYKSWMTMIMQESV